MAIESETPLTSTTNPNVRVGKYCHQCRHKTMDFVASCKAIKKNKPCRIKVCQKCLTNRYKETAEEVEMTDDWICPPCRGKCNCSVCMNNQGLEPTGRLVYKARDKGLGSVSELLERDGPETFAYQKKPKMDVASMEGTSGSHESVPEIEVVVTDVVAKTNKRKTSKKVKEEIQIEAQLPQGISLTSVSGIDIPTEEAGNVCQFLEFCLAFGKALGFEEGQAETVVRELFSCGQYCCLIKMMIQLLKFIENNRNIEILSLNATDSNWFTVLGEFLKHSKVLIDEFPPETFEGGVAEYEKMDASRRLKLLNFLCDESLTTKAIKKECIDLKYIEFENQKKEAKQKVAAAKQKKKQLKQKLQDDVAKAIMEKNGAPLSIEEHNSILSQIKAETKEADDEMMEAKGMAIGSVLRTEPILTDDNGRVLWKLNCYEEEPKFLLQDLRTFDEKWLTFKPEQKPEIEKYISAMRMKQKQTHKNTNVEKNVNAEASESPPSPKSNG